LALHDAAQVRYLSANCDRTLLKNIYIQDTSKSSIETGFHAFFKNINYDLCTADIHDNTHDTTHDVTHFENLIILPNNPLAVFPRAGVFD
jgi:hypothetical protein